MKGRRMSRMIIKGGNSLVNKYDVGRSLWKSVSTILPLWRRNNALQFRTRWEGGD